MIPRLPSIVLACALGASALAVAADAPLPRHYPPDRRERHFSTMTMLTDGGGNPELLSTGEGRTTCA